MENKVDENLVRYIVKDENYLRQNSKEVKEGEDISGIKELLEANIHYHGGYGISAIQIGIPKQVCLINVKEPIYLVNPVIKEKQGSVEYKESCLSFPNQTVNTSRSESVLVETKNFGGQLFFEPNEPDYDMDDKGLLESIVTQHEIDHLNGITIFDREVKNSPYEKDYDVGRNDRVTIEDPATSEKTTAKYKYISDKIKYDGWKVIEVEE